MKKIIFATLLLPILTLLSCSSPPELEEIYDSAVNLIEASHEINEIFFGKGLPTYPRIVALTDQTLSYSEEYDTYYLVFEDEREGELVMYFDKASGSYKFARIVKAADLTGNEGEPIFIDQASGSYLFAIDYTEEKPEYVYDEDDIEGYNVVRIDAKYLSIEEIKNAAEQVYSADYLRGVYQAAFDGLSSGALTSGGVVGARFFEQGYLLRQAENIKPLITEKRIYDYSTMKIVRPSSAKYVNISIDSHLEGSDEITNIRLSLTLANGRWYLDTPTY